MRWHQGAILLVAAAVSCWASWISFKGPEDRAAPPLPPALPRAPTAAEQEALATSWTAFAVAIAAANARRDRPIRAAELEGRDEDGAPWIPGGIPDNPLVAGVGWVVDACPPVAPPHLQPDWVLCPDTGAVWGTGASHAPPDLVAPAPPPPASRSN